MIGFQNFRGIPPPPHHYIYARILLSSNESLKIGKWENLLAAFGEKKFKVGKGKILERRGRFLFLGPVQGRKKGRLKNSLPFPFAPQMRPTFLR